MFLFFVIFCLAASDSAARLPHEDPAQLSPPEEDGQRKQHPCEKLNMDSDGLTLTHFPQLALVLHC